MLFFRDYDVFVKVLILGNGLSRLSFDAQIRSFDGEIWGCNRVYLDYAEVLTYLWGHIDVMPEAIEYRDANGLSYKIMEIEEPLQCQNRFRKDTGTTLVAEALTRGLEVSVCGFDMGGPDVYSWNHEKKNKKDWIDRWREIFRIFGSNKIEWWGFDHGPFLRSGEPSGKYARKYLSGSPHIDSDDYREVLKSWKNDYSRVMALVPHAILKNIGQHEWNLS